jgi:hypothetical protein
MRKSLSVDIVGMFWHKAMPKLLLLGLFSECPSYSVSDYLFETRTTCRAGNLFRALDIEKMFLTLGIHWALSLTLPEARQEPEGCPQRNCSLVSECFSSSKSVTWDFPLGCPFSAYFSLI